MKFPKKKEKSEAKANASWAGGDSQHFRPPPKEDKRQRGRGWPRGLGACTPAAQAGFCRPTATQTLPGPLGSAGRLGRSLIYHYLGGKRLAGVASVFGRHSDLGERPPCLRLAGSREPEEGGHTRGPYPPAASLTGVPRAGPGASEDPTI